MKDLKHIKRFNESEENLNISDVSDSQITSWEELHDIYKKDVPNWDDENPFQTFENWLQYHCEVPQLKKK
jgi:hypothetical protein